MSKCTEEYEEKLEEKFVKITYANGFVGSVLIVIGQANPSIESYGATTVSGQLGDPSGLKSSLTTDSGVVFAGCEEVSNLSSGHSNVSISGGSIVDYNDANVNNDASVTQWKYDEDTRSLVPVSTDTPAEVTDSQLGESQLESDENESEPALSINASFGSREIPEEYMSPCGTITLLGNGTTNPAAQDATPHNTPDEMFFQISEKLHVSFTEKLPFNSGIILCDKNSQIIIQKSSSRNSLEIKGLSGKGAGIFKFAGEKPVPSTDNEESVSDGPKYHIVALCDENSQLTINEQHEPGTVKLFGKGKCTVGDLELTALSTDSDEFRAFMQENENLKNKESLSSFFKTFLEEDTTDTATEVTDSQLGNTPPASDDLQIASAEVTDFQLVELQLASDENESEYDISNVSFLLPNNFQNFQGLQIGGGCGMTIYSSSDHYLSRPPLLIGDAGDQNTEAV